jgi:3-hydroxy-9,10-secoandrosta-1,3,5(10)-triene-9,17-dione monooxygenase
VQLSGYHPRYVHDDDSETIFSACRGKPVTTKADVIARAQALALQLATRADEADLRGAVSDRTIEELIEAEVFAILAPKAYGGLELDLDAFSEVVQRISAASPSTGWVAAFLMGAAWRLLMFPREAQEEMYAGRNYVLGAGSAQPIGSVVRVDGGYLLSGRSGWNSGASHAEWFTLNGVAHDAQGRPQLMAFAVPRADVTLLDSWHILGMKATASQDLSVENVFVPDYRSAAFWPALEGNSAGHALHRNPLYRIPFIPFAMNEVLPVVVGTHRGASDALSARTRSRLGTLSGGKAAEKVPAQIRLAQALARATMAEQMLAAMVAWNMGSLHNIREPAGRASIKLHASMLTTFCLDSVNEMARGVGGDAFRDDAPFQRYFRDMNTVARHAFLDPDTAGETVGRIELGLPFSDPLV